MEKSFSDKISGDVRSQINASAGLPGVYCFRGENNSLILYVGKARNLRKRLQSYLRSNIPTKTAALMAQAKGLSTTITNNETEALLLEQTLIKKHRPKFNVLFRDDKTYPYLHLSEHQDFPNLTVKRRNQVKTGKLIGPYSSSYALKETLRLLQKVFRLRQCSDDFFANRSRPCLQYQIERCSAPCVGYIAPENYQRDVEMAMKCLKGENEEVAELLQKRMDEAASTLKYEKAAHYRDRLIDLRKVQTQQSVSHNKGNLDVVAAFIQQSLMCIQYMQVRGGNVVSNRSIFTSSADIGTPIQFDEGVLLEAFFSQHYLSESFRPDMPHEILVSHPPAGRELLENALEEQQGYRVKVIINPRSNRAEWLRLAQKNAEQALITHTTNKRYYSQRILDLEKSLSSSQPLSRIECFDISHTFGEETVASCVVFSPSGPNKANYRLFNLQGIPKGDDYAAMEQVITRRFGKKVEDFPDLVCIDGGKGQMKMALRAMQKLDVDLLMIGVAKGPGRKAGLETLYVHQPGEAIDASSFKLIHLRPDSPALHFIQHLRDESHRFAIQHHRKRRAKKRKQSKLEMIPGIGAEKRKGLLLFFGSMDGVVNASIKDLQRVPGISSNLAKVVYEHLHK